MNGKCMRIIFNLIFQYVANRECNIIVHQSCRSEKYLFYCRKLFLNSLSIFKYKIKTFYIKIVL